MYSTRDKILLALENSPRHMISGASLAGRLGLTRASVWKHIHALRAEGFPIRARKASGYRLSEPFDFSLLRGEAARALPALPPVRSMEEGPPPLTHWTRAGRQGLRFWKIHYQFSTASTQAQAKAAAEQHAAEGNLWVAEKQTAGRGRLNRTWDSALGGLWVSILLRPAIVPSRVPSLTLVTALALAEAIQSETGLAARLKWPNDVVIETPKGWRKVAGILTEMSAEVDRTRWVIIGVGVNVSNRLPQALADRAVSLSALARAQVNRASLLKAFLSRLGTAYRRFEKSGFEAFRELYWRQYSLPDKAVQLKTSQGRRRGIARGVDGHGALVVESQHQTTSIWEGEIII